MPKPEKCFRLDYKMNRTGNRGEIMIYSSIGAYRWGENDPTVTSRDFDKALRELGDVDELTIRINSPGGAVNEAVAMRACLMKHRAAKLIDIEGSCCSAATIIASLPGARVRIAKGSDYMIHRCSWFAWGHADAMMSAYQSMTNTDNDLADMYAERTGKSKEECLELMKAETWYNAEDAIKNGFADELLTAEEEDVPIAACAITAEIYETMKANYAHVPEHSVGTAAGGAAGQVSNEESAVAAGNSSENTGDTPENKEGHSMELRDATAEMLQLENPELAQRIAGNAITAERERIARIRKLTRKGAKWEAMRDRAIEEGTSVEDYLQAVIAEEEKTGKEFLDNRRDEVKNAEKIGAGDAGDNDDPKEAENKAAKEIAELAKGISGDFLTMA